MTGRVGALGQGTAVSLVLARHPQPLCWPPDHTPLPLSPFSPCPHTHVAVPCSQPPATNLQGTRSWSHTGPPTPVAPRPHCHSPRMWATAIGAMRQEQLGDSESAAEKRSGRRAAVSSSFGQHAVMSSPHVVFVVPKWVVVLRAPSGDTHRALHTSPVGAPDSVTPPCLTLSPKGCQFKALSVSPTSSWSEIRFPLSHSGDPPAAISPAQSTPPRGQKRQNSCRGTDLSATHLSDEFSQSSQHPSLTPRGQRRTPPVLPLCPLTTPVP